MTTLSKSLRGAAFGALLAASAVAVPAAASAQVSRVGKLWIMRTLPFSLGGEGRSRSETDEGAVSTRSTFDVVSASGVPLIRAALRPAFSPEGRRKNVGVSHLTFHFRPVRDSSRSAASGPQLPAA